jgi:hypothetical protein
MDSPPTVPIFDPSFDLIETFGRSAPAAPPPTHAPAPVCELMPSADPASQWKDIDDAFGQNATDNDMFYTTYVTMPVTAPVQQQQRQLVTASQPQTSAPIVSPTDSFPAASKRPKRRAAMKADGASAALGRGAPSAFSGGSNNAHSSNNSNNMSQCHIAASQVEEDDDDNFNFDSSYSNYGSEHRHSCKSSDSGADNSNNNSSSSRTSGTGRRRRNDPQRNARLAKENRERKKAYIAGLEAELEELRTAKQEADRVGGGAVREAEQLRAENAMLRTTLSEQRALAPIFHAMQTVPNLTFAPPAEASGRPAAAGSKRAADADSSGGGNNKRMLPLTFLVQLSDPPRDGAHRS